MANTPSHARIAFLAVAIIAGCSGQATPNASVAPSTTSSASQPAPTPTPTATPSPTPDPAQRVLRRLKSDPTTTWTIVAKETIPSSITFRSESGSAAPSDITIDSPDIVINFKGVLITVGEDYFFRLEPLDDNPAVVEALQQSGTTLWRFADQGWETSKPTARLPDVIRSIRSLTPDGSIQKDGQSLQRFRTSLAEPIQLAMLWHVDAPRREPDTGELVVHATSDGTPVSLLVTITSDDFTFSIPDFPDGPPRSYQFEFRRASPIDGFAVPDPAPTLSMTRIQRHAVAIGLPANWSAGTPEEGWVWHESDTTERYIGVLRTPVPAGAADDPVRQQTRGWTRNWTKWVTEALKVEPAMVELIGVGPEVGGVLTTWVVPAKGSDGAFLRIDATFVHGAWAYVVRWESDPKDELADRYLFERVLESIDFDT